MLRPWAFALVSLLLAWLLPGLPAIAHPDDPQLRPRSFADGPEFGALPFSRQTYYVDPQGSDGSDGSEGSPWLTLQHAVDSVALGDTILVRSGTYAGMRIETSGQAGARITLRAAPGATVVVNTPGPANRHGSNVEVETWEGEGSVAWWVIQGLEVTGAPNWGIDLRGNEEHHSHHFTLRGNRVHHNGVASGKTGIFTAFADDLLLEGNESWSNGEHGIYLSNSGDRFQVRGNRLHHNAACGLHLNGDASMGGDGIISDGVVEANVIYENGAAGGAAVNMDGVTDTLLCNNLLYGNHAGGFTLFQQDGAVASRRNRLLNNIVLMPEDGRWAINLAQAECVDNRLQNNIVLTEHPWRGAICLAVPAPAGLISDDQALADRFSVDGGESAISLAQWQSLGYDGRSFVATPAELFREPAAGDYHHREGSPALDAGATLAEVTEDLEGVSRPAGPAYDLGAYERPLVTAAVAAGRFLPGLFMRAVARRRRCLKMQGARSADAEACLRHVAGGRASATQQIRADAVSQ